MYFYYKVTSDQKFMFTFKSNYHFKLHTKKFWDDFDSRFEDFIYENELRRIDIEELTLKLTINELIESSKVS